MEITLENYSIAPIHQKNAWRICDFVVSNENYLKTYFPETLKENLTPTLAELFVAKKQKQFAQKQEYLFVIKENTNRSIVGLIYVKDLQKVENEAELAYCIGYQYFGKGLMSKFVKAIINWSFDEAKLLKIRILVHETNLASIRVAEKNNFAYVKKLPDEHQLSDGSFIDMQLYELKNPNIK